MLHNDIFIEVVKSNPVLWKSSDKNHRNKMLVKKAWEEMQATVFPNVSVDDLKRRWKNLKDQYRKEIRRLPPTSAGAPLRTVNSHWRYFDPLSFLKDEFAYYVPRRSSQDSNSNPIQCEDDHHPSTSKPEVYEIEIDDSPESNVENNEQMSTKSDEEYELTKDSRKRPIPNKIREEMIEIERKKLKLIEDEVKRTTFERTDNYHFFMSLLPEVEKLPSLQKMSFRSKVTTALIEELTIVQQLQEPRNQSQFNTAPEQSALGIHHSIDIKYEPDNTSELSD